MDSFEFWYRWLLIASIILIFFGVVLALFNQSLFFDFIFNIRINPYFWGGNEPDSTALHFQQWAYGVLGATIAGWGVIVFFIIRQPFRNQERWAWTASVAGIGLWYILDTFISIAAGVFYNAVFNTLLLAVFMVPLIFTRRFFME